MLDDAPGCTKVQLCLAGFAAENHRGGKFPSSDQNDARSEARRVRLNVRVGRCRVDPVYDGIQRHGPGPFLDISQQHAAGASIRARLGLRRCPVVEGRRKFGAADELAPRPPDMNQGEITGSKRAAVALVAFERPHLGT